VSQEVAQTVSVPQEVAQRAPVQKPFPGVDGAYPNQGSFLPCILAGGGGEVYTHTREVTSAMAGGQLNLCWYRI
jgi:hypothetical protein